MPTNRALMTSRRGACPSGGGKLQARCALRRAPCDIPLDPRIRVEQERAAHHPLEPVTRGEHAQSRAEVAGAQVDQPVGRVGRLAGVAIGRL
jgi:hypothetical protein